MFLGGIGICTDYVSGLWVSLVKNKNIGLTKEMTSGWLFLFALVSASHLFWVLLQVQENAFA